MAEISNKFKVKKGLEVVGDTIATGNVDVSGYITVPNQLQTENSTKVANTAYVRTAISNLVATAPAALDTLNELATALGNDANFATTVSTSLGLKAPLASPALSGIPTAPTATANTNTDQIATTKYVDTADALKANLASPDFSGTPLSITAAVDTNTRQIATTAFVLGQAADTTSPMNGTATVGTSKRYARQDHVHPSDTSKLDKTGGTLTGSIYVSTDNSYIGVDTTATPRLGFFKKATLGPALAAQNSNILSFGHGDFAAIGTGAYTERMQISSAGNLLIGTSADNATDKLQVNGSVSATTFKGSAALTGTPTAPTATAGLSNQQIANTQFVANAIANNNQNPVFSGDTTFGGTIATNDFRMLEIPNAARYATTTSGTTVTGAFKITLPVLYPSAYVSMRVVIQDNASNKSFEMLIHGNMFNTSSTWGGNTAITYGEALGKNPTVRYGNDGTKSCIWIGELADTWNTPSVFITDVQIGYAGQTNAWMGAWSVAPVTAFDTVKIGPFTPTKMAGTDSPTFTGIPIAPTATAATNTDQIATTKYVTSMGALKANIASPTFTGVPNAPTATPGTNTDQIATTKYVDTAVSGLVSAAPAALDTLKELATALGNDASFSTTVTNSLALKAPLATPIFTGKVETSGEFVGSRYGVIRGGANTGDGGGQLVLGYGNGVGNTVAGAANNNYSWNIGVDSLQRLSIWSTGSTGTNKTLLITDNVTRAPTITDLNLDGIPTAVAPTNGDSSSQIATTKFVQDAMDTTLTKSITGSVTLTATELTNRVIIFTGALTAATIITIPSGVGRWLIDNRTTGAYTLTVKMSTGTGVTIPQNYRKDIINDGSNVVVAETDYTDAYLAGTPTVVTPATTDNTTRIPSTAYVVNRIANDALLKTGGTVSGAVTVNNTVTLVNNDLMLKASTAGTGSDPGDLVFMDSAGTELDRLWHDTTNKGTLLYRANGGASYGLWHGGNLLPVAEITGGAQLLANATDLNTIKTTGFYRGSTLTNAPGAGWWYVIVEGHDGFWTKQTATAYGSGNTANDTYVRTLLNGTWSSWVKFQFEGTNITAGTLKVDMGTAAAPTFTFATDLDTGVYSPAANQIALATAGVQQLKLDSTGLASFANSIGIGEVAASTSYNINMQKTYNANGTRYGINNVTLVDNTTALTAARTAIGAMSRINFDLSEANRAGFTSNLYGGWTEARLASNAGGESAVSLGMAQRSYILNQAGSGLATDLRGSYNIIYSTNALGVASQYGTYNYIQIAATATGVHTNVYGTYNRATITTGATATIDRYVGTVNTMDGVSANYRRKIGVYNGGISCDLDYSVAAAFPLVIGHYDFTNDIVTPRLTFAPTTGQATFANNVVVSGTLTSTGTVVANSGLAVTGGLTVSGASALNTITANSVDLGVSVDNSGSISVTGTTAVTVDSWATGTYRSAKYQAQIADGSSYETLEFLVIHDGTTAYMTTYGNVFTGSASLGNFDATISSGTLNVTYTATAATSKTVNLLKTAMKV